MLLPNLQETDLLKLRSELCKRDFFEFVKEFWSVIIPEDPVYNWHIQYLCESLQVVAERVIAREIKTEDVIINIPPGTSKSTIATVMLPAWIWTKDASIRALTASYSSSLSTDHAVKSRDIIKSKKYQALFPDVVIKMDQDNKTHYKNTKGGERYATSITGAAMGFHAHIIIVDDPLNPKKASSDVERQSANDFMDTTLSTRKVHKEKTVTILIMQRLHEDDCTGNWLNKKGKKIFHICLPGTLTNDVKPAELKEHYVNDLLDVNRLSQNALDDLRIDLGSYGYAGQIMQTPAPKEGGIWQKWIIPVKAKDIPPLTRLGSDFDTAYTEKEKNSASAYVTAGVNGSRMYITAIGFEWVEFPALIQLMERVQKPIYIEGKASGKSAKQVLTSRGIPAIEIKVDGGDKQARAQFVTPYAESGIIYCDESLLDKLYNHEKQGILKFPNNHNDDLQDALVQSINRLLITPKAFSF